MQVGTIQHEFAHAIGMEHEQSRSDRDEWITILYDNIKDGLDFAFNKEQTHDKNPYNLESVMQYGLYVSKGPTRVEILQGYHTRSSG